MRINCIPVTELTDQHLRAEWVEMLMLPAYLYRSLRASKTLELSKSKTYVLNTGHARFFYDKLLYVEKRYRQLEVEMLRRGYQANPKLDLSDFPKELFNDWIPTEEDMAINLNRILTRISLKPDWYTYAGEHLRYWQIHYEHRFENYKYTFLESDVKR